MIEMSRGTEAKKRKRSRKEKIITAYQKAKNGIDNYERLFKTLKSKDEQEFNKEKLYLYFLQEGKSLYSGKPLNVEELDLYEVDHIIPRTLIKDDSFENKALVLKEENQLKAASFTVPVQFRSKENIAWWNRLKNNELMSSKKFNNLKRDRYRDEDINRFINRQIVETRQISKHVANILTNYHKKTKVIYLKANLSSEFRQKFEIFKYRDLNDYHHAHDAYLAAALGYYKEKFLKETNFESLKARNYELYQEGEYKYNRSYSYLINNIDEKVIPYDEKSGEVLIDNKVFIKTVEKTLYNSDILVSKKVEIKSGEFYHQNLSKKGKGGVQSKGNLNTEYYGSYSTIYPSYACVIKFTKKGKDNQRMIGIPIYIDKLHDQMVKEDYIRHLFKLTREDSLEIVKDKIPFNVILNWDGQICSLRGASDTVEVCNAKEFIIDKKHLFEWKYTLNKVLNGQKNDNLSDEQYNKQLSEIVIYIVDRIQKEYKLYNDLVDKMKNYFKYDNISKLTTDEKEIIIKQMFKLLKFNPEQANLKSLNSELSTAFGKKNQRIISHATIIYKSVTGLYEDKDEF